jgi:hypothetical protein
MNILPIPENLELIAPISALSSESLKGLHAISSPTKRQRKATKEGLKRRKKAKEDFALPSILPLEPEEADDMVGQYELSDDDFQTVNRGNPVRSTPTDPTKTFDAYYDAVTSFTAAFILIGGNRGVVQGWNEQKRESTVC